MNVGLPKENTLKFIPQYVQLFGPFLMRGNRLRCAFALNSLFVQPGSFAEVVVCADSFTLQEFFKAR